MSSLQALNERICEHCGAPMVEHDYEHLARECYPKQIERLQIELDQAQRLLQVRKVPRMPFAFRAKDEAEGAP